MLTRLPVPGQVKTRLVPALGCARAAEVHRELAERVAAELRPLAATGEAELVVWHEGGTARAMRAWLGSLPRYEPQGVGDLGGRLRALFEQAFAERAARCVAVGSDCPSMTAGHVRRALQELGQNDVVLGPAADGGYWLVGLRAAAAERALGVLFDDMPWGGSRVLAESLDRARAARLALALLDELADVDRPEDLPAWEQLRARQAELARVSVIVPTLQEGSWVGPTVRAALAAGSDEVIVADGGSIDGTRAEAAAAGARVLDAPRGRARQMNEGARHACGDVLLFLHADTLVPAHGAELVRAALREPGVVAGAFEFAVPPGGLPARIITAGGRARCRLSGYPYGDQGLFLRADTFRALGGFPELPVMEDWELVHRLRKLGRVAVLGEAAVTSARSFEEHGLIAGSMVNVAVIVAYQLGADPHRLAVWRRRLSSRKGAQP
jgi:rSAM/selenodomain-associated transferase 2/rSAM/selenodomain-associated transferase 1